MIKAPEKIRSKNLDEVWKWKDEVSDEFRGKTFDEVKKILKKSMEEYKAKVKK
jgi:hypothetical protein